MLLEGTVVFTILALIHLAGWAVRASWPTAAVFIVHVAAAVRPRVALVPRVAVAVLVLVLVLVLGLLHATWVYPFVGSAKVQRRRGDVVAGTYAAAATSIDRQCPVRLGLGLLLAVCVDMAVLLCQCG